MAGEYISSPVILFTYVVNNYTIISKKNITVMIIPNNLRNAQSFED